jgi:hypothetical protein
MPNATLLEIVQDASEDIGVGAPGTVINNDDETAIQMLRLVKRESRNLSFAHPWSQLTFEHTISANGTSSSYALPSDFAHIIPETVWDRTGIRPLVGPLSPKDWQKIQSGAVVSTGFNSRWRIWQSLFFIYPRTQSGNTLAFEYKTDKIVLTSAGASAGTSKVVWNADTDVARFLDGELLTLGVIWRFKKAKGLPYADEIMEYITRRDLDIAKDGGSRILDASVNNPDPFMTNYNTPEAGFG